MKKRTISPYAQNLFTSGRGEHLIKLFIQELILSKRIPDHRVSKKELQAKHREKVKQSDSVHGFRKSASTRQTERGNTERQSTNV